MSTPDRLLQARREYEALGLRMTPLIGKRPLLPDWQRRRLTAEQLDRAVRAGYGLGCVHSQSGTATLDIDAALELAALALEAVGVDLEELLEGPGPKTIGNPARPPKPWYRLPEGLTLSRRVLNWPKEGRPGAREVVLELRTGAVQDALPPTLHPDTGEPYRWTPDAPQAREDLPLIPGPLLNLWRSWSQLRPTMEAACPWAEPPRPPAPTVSPRRLPRSRRGPRRGPSVIEAWNASVPAGGILERNGYRRKAPGRWVCPDSTSGDPGVVLLEGGAVFSHHGSDPLADGRAHDAFDALRLLEHGGATPAAVRAAARELGRPLLASFGRGGVL